MPSTPRRSGSRRGGARARPRAPGRRRQRRHRRGPRRAPRQPSARLPTRYDAAPRRLPRPALRRPGLHAPGDRHGRHRDALVGGDRRGRPAAARAGRPGRPRPVGSGARHRRPPRRGGAACGGQPPGSRASRRPSWRRARRRRIVPSLVPARGRARGARADRRRRPALRAPRDEQDPGRVVRVGDRHAQLRLADPVVAARGDRVVLRGETTVGGGVVLDPAPPRRVDAERDQAPRGGRPGLDRPGARPRSGRGRAARCAGAAERSGARGRPRRRPRRRRLGVLGRVARGDGCGGRGSPARTCRASPLDPGLVLAELLPAEPWAAAVLDLLPVERRGAKVVLPGTAARSARAATRPRRSRRASPPAARRDEGRRRRARPVPRGGRAPGAARRRLRGRRRGLRGRVRSRRDRMRGAPARSRWRGSATSRAWAAATRSSCSSGWTSTGSRAASETGGYCDARRARAREPCPVARASG